MKKNIKDSLRMMFLFFQDFSILLHALEEYEAAREKSPSALPPLPRPIPTLSPHSASYTGIQKEMLSNLVFMGEAWV